ncbi:MAG: hypothetical protein AAF153_01355, partial [Pseudomonadota bacterium]
IMPLTQSDADAISMGQLAAAGSEHIANIVSQHPERCWQTINNFAYIYQVVSGMLFNLINTQSNPQIEATFNNNEITELRRVMYYLERSVGFENE